MLSEVISVWGSSRVGLRLSPLNSYNSMNDSDPTGLTQYLSRELNSFNLAYLHLMRSDFFGIQSAPVMETARQEFKNVLIGNMGYSPQEAAKAIAENKADLIAFGHHYVSNPNLVQKIREGRTLVEPDPSTYYTPGSKGYSDYPEN